MMNSLDLTGKLAIDSKSVDDLQLLSRKDSKKALQEAAKQFEALFFNMLVKSMRDATIESGLIDSEQTKFYTEMYDQQLSQTLASKGIGLADMMVKQLTRTYGEFSKENNSVETTSPIPDAPLVYSESVNQHAQQLNHLSHQTETASQAKSGSTEISQNNFLSNVVDKSTKLWAFEHFSTETFPSSQAITNNFVHNTAQPENIINKTSNMTISGTSNFFSTLMPHASNASEATGIPAHFILAQAALESGWGKHEIRHPDNSPSHNLFGIKAGNNWQGDTVETITTEYINGIPQKTVEIFRAYSSYEEGFRDYASLLSNNPRYANVVNTQNPAEFAYGLQKAGYATDPQYGNKIMRILSNPALSNQDVI